MSTPAGRRSANIRLSWQRAVGTSLSVSTITPAGVPAVITVPVNYENPYADPDKMASPKTAPQRAWVDVAWLEEGAGRRGHSIVQVDIHVRIGPKGAATSDPYGITVDDVADAFEDVFSGIRVDGTFKGWVHVLDFSQTPLSPDDTDECIFVYNPGRESSWGQPVSRNRLPTYEGVQRIVLRYAMRLKTDATSGLSPAYV